MQRDRGGDVGLVLLLHDSLALQQQLQSAGGQAQVPQPQADLRQGRQQGAGEYWTVIGQY